MKRFIFLIFINITLIFVFIKNDAIAQPFYKNGIAKEWRCYRNDYASVLSTDSSEHTGSEFLIRNPTSDASNDCSITVRKTDVVRGVDDAHYYIRLINSFLIIDDGTGPDRSLFIYEVPNGKKLIDVGYSVQGLCDPTQGCDSDEFRITNEGVTFWAQTTEKAIKSNCKKYSVFMKTTGSAAIEKKSFFSFKTHELVGSRVKRCTARQ